MAPIPAQFFAIVHRMPRTPRDWTADLYPELDQVAAFRNRFKGKVLSLRDLGLRRAMEAEALGHVCVREAVGRRTSALWAHEDLLPELEAAAAEIAELRAERARREEARRLERIARITEALDDVTWMTAEDRALARSHLESLPVEEVSRGAIERRLLARRLARAIEGLPRLTARSTRIAIAADIRFSAFGREITETWDPVTTIDLTPELEQLLFSDDLAPFRAAVQETARAAAAAAVSELRVRLFATIAEAGRTIEETVTLVEFTEPTDVERVRASLVDHAVQRLESSGERALATLQKSLRDIAADLIWSRRRDLLRAGRASREGQWTVAGDRRNPVLVYTIEPQVTALGEVFTARMGRKVSLPRDLREALFRQPFDVFTAIAETYVAEQ
ncbi:MAG TPA: hypothetical protein PLF26_14775, partial [Blastocatellia bacterium]|nr:hypothetical protein [Blastocatellia bacterium]